ncbi:putative multiheme cytochrome c [Thermincola ferriacetica]|uniref:Putative multiheme cytochrome c n=1 Tax=Thermincola ferriacetica TaxID=281456 RepID=A0A0L6W4N2_9FIRM|nr:FlgD immunoglobulin-like domain containing protein [Thermincola ferriacetica]KNZ70537.1 putative multiheme cytochrome c [Thermincola ferriacetica]
MIQLIGKVGNNGSKKVVILVLAVLVAIAGISIATAVGEISLSISPDPIKLGSNANIVYTLGENSYVTIDVFKESGEKVRTVLNNVYKYAGTNYQTWDGKDANNVLVPDGNYKIVVTAKDAGGATIGSAEKTVLAARSPGITGVTDDPDPFNPSAGQQWALNYTLTSNAKVTISILKNYVPVRTIASNVTQDAGTYSVTWDGKLGDGSFAADGTYMYQIYAESPLVSSFNSAYRAYVTVEKDPPKVTDFSLSSDLFKIAGSTMSIRYTLSEDAAVTMKVYDSGGNVVKTILENAPKKAGYNSSSWDGKFDNTNYIPEGSYSVVINAVDNSGKSSGDRTVNFKAGFQPTISNLSVAPVVFDPTGPTNNQATVSYTLSNDALVTAQILNGSVPVRTIVDKQQRGSGVNSVIWDGKDDNGNVVADGSYIYQIKAQSAVVDTFCSTAKGTVTVEKGAPKITDLTLSPEPYKLGAAGVLSIRYNLSENAMVSVNVYQGDLLVRKIITAKSQNAGSNGVSWDGKNEANNFVDEGIYTVTVSAVDSTGLTGQVSGTVTAGYLPVISNATHTPEPYDPAQGSATFKFDLSSDANITVTIMNGSLPVRTISEKNVPFGSRTITWDGKDNSGQPVKDGFYTYQIEAVSPMVETFRSIYKGTVTVESGAPAINDIIVAPTVAKVGYQATFRYTLSEPATVSAQILKSETLQVVRDFPSETKTAGGYYSLTWDTRDNGGNLVLTGDYIIKISATDSFGKAGSSELAFQAAVPPQITNVKATPQTIDLSTGQTTTTISYNVSEDSYVTLKVFDANNQVWKTLRSYEKISAGADSVVLNVYENGRLVTGTLKYTIDASSVIGYYKAAQASGAVEVTGELIGPPLPPSEPNNCKQCHAGYPVVHPMNNCFGCHGDNEPLQDCAFCHPTWQTHSDGSVLEKYECEFCHNPTYSYKIPAHGDINVIHTADVSADCEKCHDRNLTVEHPKYADPVTLVPYDCNTCHQSTKETVQQAIYNRQTNCSACHGPTSGHEEMHVTTALDANCTTCHINSLTQEHLNNPKTQTDPVTGQAKSWTCDTCHASTQPAVVGALSTGNRQCAACHREAHNIMFAETVPADIPLYRKTVGDVVYTQWTQPQDASLWAGESWMPDEFLVGGKVVISNRRPDHIGDTVWNFYKTELAAQGWTLASEAPMPGANFFNVTFRKDKHKVMIWFYGGATHNASDQALPAGYRIEVIYK